MARLVPEMSDAAVRRLRHRDGKAAVYAVGGVSGLLLVCKSPTSGEGVGSRSWILRIVIGSKRRDIGLGGYPDVTLAQARHKARELREQIRQGVDPLAERKAQQSALMAQQAKAITFAELAREYIAKKSAEYKPGSRQTQRLTGHIEYASASIGKMTIADIERAHIVKILEPIWETKNETASRVRLHVERVLDLAGVKGLRSGDNPARWRGNLDLTFPARAKVAKVESYRALPMEQMPDFWATLRTAETISARALQFIILTATRSGEARGTTWDEIDLSARLWTIPAARMKAGREHKVPLSDAAVEVLESMPRLSSHVFAGPTGKPLSDVAVAKALRLAGCDATVHGFRATFRTWAQECTAFPEEVCELALAHVNTDATRAAYARGELLDKRRALMAEWDRFCFSATPKQATSASQTEPAAQ